MSNSIPLEIAEAIQSTSIKRAPSPSHDINPSTSYSEKIPVTVNGPSLIPDHEEYDNTDEEDVPYSALNPTPRHGNFPLIADMRFEQSYLASISGAETWWMIAWITVENQVIFPLLQGVLLNVATLGWRHWNRNAQMSGGSVGARVRRWWFQVNNWPIEETLKDRKLAESVGDFYQNQAVWD